MNRPWIIDFNSPSDPRKGIKVGHIESGNDGDVCNSCVTYEILNGLDNKYCIDIGVDEGWWSLFAASINPNCKIEAFEPNPISYNLLLPYLKAQITLHNLAISDKCGLLPFNAAGGESHSRSESKTSVICTTIDEFIKNKFVNLIKIDTEGHDLKILKTLHYYIDQIKAIIFECSVYWYGSSEEECIQNTIEELLFLKSHYTYMYILSRRGDPLLISLLDENDIKQFIMFSYKNKYQVDILVCHSPILSVPSQRVKFN